FLSNAIEVLLGDTNLINLRSRGKFVRPFDKVREIEDAARSRWQEEEEKLKESMTSLDNKIKEQMKGKGAMGQQVIMSSEVQEKIEQFKKERSEVQRRLREVRKNLRSDIEYLGNWLKFVNIALMPILIAVFGLAFATVRSRRIKA
ncbi:MAG: hypothetical protein HQL31_04430, partial [Planctomycetes bacterium]|nr:hypothetical protein [Planctomycetota bacterium]